MNKNTKTKKPQAKVAKGKTTKKVSTPTNKKPSATKVKEPAAKRRVSTAAAVKDKELVAKKRTRVKIEELSEPIKQVVKKRTQWVKTEEPSEPIKQVAKRRTAVAAKVKELSGKESDDEATKLKREQCLKKLRQYYCANREKICKKQNSKYPDRKKRVKNNPELMAKQREASRTYYYQNKDQILPKLKKRYVEKVAKEKGLEICPCCGKLKGPADKRVE